MITICGINCESECHAYGAECPGCAKLEGKVSWAGFIGRTVCPIYECAQKRGYKTCLECAELPCHFWLVETKHPAISDEENARYIEKRIENLKAEK